MDTNNEADGPKARSSAAFGYETVRDGMDWAVVAPDGRRVTLLAAKCRADQVCEEINRLAGEVRRLRRIETTSRALVDAVTKRMVEGEDAGGASVLAMFKAHQACELALTPCQPVPQR